MLVRSLRRFFGSLFSEREQLRRTLDSAARRSRPRVEALEERWAPAVCRFTNPTGGAWETPANWTDCNDGIPQAGDDVDLRNRGENMRVTLSTATPALRQFTGVGNANLATTLELLGNAVLHVDVALQALTNFTLAMGSTTTFRVNPNGAYSFTSSTFNYGSGAIQPSPVGTHPIINLISATLGVGPRAGESPDRFFASTACTLNGSLRAGQTLTMQALAGNIDLNVTAGSSNHGTILLSNASGAARNVNLVIANGTFTNGPGGEIRAIPGPGAGGGGRDIFGHLVNSGRVIGTSQFEIRGTYDSAGGFLQGSTFVVDSQVIVSQSPPVGEEAILVLRGNNTLQGNNLVRTRLVVQGANGPTNAQLTVAAGARNAGTILLENVSGAARTVNLAIAGEGGFTNAPGGVLRATAGPGAGGGVRNVFGHFRNESLVQGSGATPLDFRQTYESAGGTLEGSVVVGEGGQVMVSQSPPVGVEAVIPMRGNTTLVGSNLPRTTLVAQGANGPTNAELTVAAGERNAGTIRLENASGAARTVNLAVAGEGAFTNAAGGLIQVIAGPGAGGPRSVNGSLANSGVFDVRTVLTLRGDVTNSGTVQVSAALTIAGQTVNSGTIQMGSTFATVSLQNTPQGEITGSGTVTPTNPFTNLGTISVPAGTLTINNLRNYDPDSRTLTSGTYNVTGTLRFGNTTTSIQTNAANIILTGPNSAILPLTGTVNTLANLAVIRPGASFEVNNRNFNTAAAAVVPLFQNEGTLRVRVNSRFQVTAAYTQAPTAVADIDGGRLRIQGDFANVVDGVLTSGIYRVAGPDAVSLGVLQFNGTLTGNAATLVLRGPGASIRDLQEGDALRDLAVNSGRFTVERYPPDGAGRNHTLTIPLANTDQGIITVGSGSSLSGDFTNLTGGTLSGGTYIVGGLLRFTNGDGELRNLAASLTLQLNAQVLNAVGANFLTTLETITETGTLVFGDGADFSTVADLINRGTLTVGAASTFRIAADFTNTGTVRVLVGGTLEADFRLTNFDPDMSQLNGGTYIIAGTFQFAAANIVFNAATFTLEGTEAIVRNVAGLSAFRNFATNEGVFTLQGGAGLFLPGAFQNSGTLAILGGSSYLVLGGDYTQTAGQTLLRDGFIDGTAGSMHINGGELSGSGYIFGNVRNASQVTVGGLRATGILYIYGDYTQTSDGSLNLELGGTTAGEGYDQLFVTGVATLAGALNVMLLGDYFPSLGDCFDVLVAGNRVGTFATTMFPDLGAELIFEAIYGESGLQLCVNAR